MGRGEEAWRYGVSGRRELPPGRLITGAITGRQELGVLNTSNGAEDHDQAMRIAINEILINAFVM